MTDQARYAELPRSTATNAYDLLSEVIEAIKAEPKRLHMGWWLHQFKGTRVWGALDPDLPRCGTVACVGGWLAILAARPKVKEIAKTGYGTSQLGTLGAKILRGDEPRLIGSLFQIAVEILFAPRVENERERVLSPNSPEYVPMVVKRIEAFQAQWRDRLMSTPVNQEERA